MNEMVSDQIWAPEFFVPREIWALSNLGPRNLVPTRKSLYSIFMQGPTFLGPKFLEDQISRGSNFLGPKKVRGPNEIGDHFSYIQSLQFHL